METCTTLQGQSVLSRIEKLIQEDLDNPPFESSLSPSNSLQPAPAMPEPTASLRRVISASQFERQTYQRMLGYQRKKEEKIRLEQEHKALASLAEVKSGPCINRSSCDLQHIPLSERAGDIVKKKEDWRKQQAQERQALRLAQEDPELTFHPKIAQKPRNRRTVEEFEIYLESTKDKHEREMERLKAVAEAKTAAELKFTPEISQRSLKMMQKKGSLAERLADEEILSAIRREEAEKKYAPTFHPAISRKSTQLASKRSSQLPVFHRLYESAATSASASHSPKSLYS